LGGIHDRKGFLKYAFFPDMTTIETMMLPVLLMGFVVGLDTTAAFQIMVSQPLVACTILGWMVGDPVTGVSVGVVTQLLWMGKLPVGAATFPDGNLGALVAAALVLHFRNLTALDGIGVLLAMGVMWGALTAWAGGREIIIKRKIHTRWITWFETQSQQGKLRAYSRGHWLVTFWNGLIGAVSAGVFFIIGSLILGVIVPELPAQIHRVGYLIPYLLLGVGLTQILILFRIDARILQRWGLTAAGLVVGLILWKVH
jgi:PTS system mannose-specific IIC component